jgi:PhnB protein
MSKSASAKPPERPPAVPLAPYLSVSNAKDAIAFYERAFGAKLAYRQDTPDGRVLHADLRLPNGGAFMLCDDFPEMGAGESRTPQKLGGTPVTLHLDVPDVDATWRSVLAAGAKVEMPLADQFWGARYGVVSDPFGHRWSMATEKRQPSRQELDAAATKLGKPPG